MSHYIPRIKMHCSAIEETSNQWRQKGYSVDLSDTSTKIADHAFLIAAQLNQSELKSIPEAKLNLIAASIERTALSLKALCNLKKHHYETPSEDLKVELTHLRDHVCTLAEASIPWISLIAIGDGGIREAAAKFAAEANRITALAEAEIVAQKNRDETFKDQLARHQATVQETVSAKFSDFFGAKASQLEDASRKWLGAAIFFCTIAFSAPVLLEYSVEGTEGPVLARLIAGKITIIAISVSGAVWCGKIYKAVKHQATLYSFKALGLKTFLTLIESTKDKDVRAAIIMETTRAIYAQPASGYIAESGGDSHVVEIMKNVGAGNS